MERTGKCMCGSVTFKTETKDGFGACYCKMCQRWAAGVYMGVHCTSFELTGGEQHFTIFKSSDWAERAFCNKCGSSIYYHAPDHGAPSVALGALDDTDELKLDIQFFIDQQPAGFSLAETTKTMTAADIAKIFGPV